MTEHEPPPNKLDADFLKGQEEFMASQLDWLRNLLFCQEKIDEHFSDHPDHAVVLALNPKDEIQKESLIKDLSEGRPIELNVTPFIVGILGVISGYLKENLVKMGKGKEVGEIVELFNKNE